MTKKYKPGDYQEQEMTIELAFKYLEEFAEKNNLDDDATVLIIHSVDYINKYFNKYHKFYKFIKPKLTLKQKDDYIEYLEE